MPFYSGRAVAQSIGALVLLGSLLGAGSLACQSSASNSQGSAPPASQTVALNGGAASGDAAPGSGAFAAGGGPALSVAEALAATPNASIVVHGLFLGWKGPCKGVPPSRSAWQLADEDRPGAPCIYVDGPAPAGLSPTDPSAKGTRVRAQGTLTVEETKPFLVGKQADRE